MKSGQKTGLSKEEKRGAILHAAWALIRQKGFHKTTVDEIATDAGVAKGTVYLYFESKTDVMLELVDITNSRIADEQDRIAKRLKKPEDRIREVIKHRVMTLFDIINRYPYGEEMVTSLLPNIVNRLDRYVLRHGELLASIIVDGCKSGDFDIDDMDGKGAILARLFEHLTPPYYRFDSRRNLEQFTNQLLDLLLAGLWSRRRK